MKWMRDGLGITLQETRTSPRDKSTVGEIPAAVPIAARDGRDVDDVFGKVMLNDEGATRATSIFGRHKAAG